ENGKKYVSSTAEFDIGVDSLPNFKKDTTDRNRTSPFAFTGNKFEFRMLGSADSISCTNVILNTIIAEELSQFADELEKADDFNKALKALLVRTIKEHKQIIFNGNGYADEWLAEAERRGLPNLVSTVDAIPEYTKPEYVSMFEKFKVYTKVEIESRTEILLENYAKVITIEALTMLDMARKLFLPAAMKAGKDIADTALVKKELGIDNTFEIGYASRVSALTAGISEAVTVLDEKVIASQGIENVEAQAKFCRSDVFVAMQSLRALVDELETIVSAEVWPVPSYTDLLFTV
ncbi:MAG: glutamine synthetase type III, partial [Oscillospiraceae bacterium]|nr:glutamine synthetase type III [Oscillospiraceae bacterium]